MSSNKLLITSREFSLIGVRMEKLSGRTFPLPVVNKDVWVALFPLPSSGRRRFTSRLANLETTFMWLK